MNILHLLANDGFICVNKLIIKQLGLEAAVLVGELASIYTYNKDKGTLYEDQWFYATVEKIKENTGMSDYIQQKSIDKLCELGILKQQLQGMPRKRYLTLDEKKLLEIIVNKEVVQYPKIRIQASENSDTCSPKIRIQASENSDTIYNNKYNNTNDKTDNTQAGEISNSNAILEKNISNQLPNPPRVSAPRVHPTSLLGPKVKSKLIGMEKDAQKALVDYCLFLQDQYNFGDTQLCNRIDEVKRKARNIAQGIEIICQYNTNGGYRKLFVPGNLGKQVAESVVVSEKASEEDFVKDDEGNVEEIW